MLLDTRPDIDKAEIIGSTIVPGAHPSVGFSTSGAPLDRPDDSVPVFDRGAWGDLLAAEDGRSLISGDRGGDLIASDLHAPGIQRTGFSRMLHRRWDRKKVKQAA